MFQPIRELKTQRILGYESLLRGNEDPMTLITSAIKNNAILELEYYSHSLSLDSFIPFTKGDSLLFINFYPTTLLNKEYLTKFKQLVDRYTTSNKVVVEITEHEEVNRLELLKSVSYLSSNGFKIAIDDYGVNHSIDYIYDVQPDIIKLDKACVKNWSPIFNNTVNKMKEWCMDQRSILIAEGIETSEQLKLVMNAGIDFGQGWLLGKPDIPKKS